MAENSPCIYIQFKISYFENCALLSFGIILLLLYVYKL